MATSFERNSSLSIVIYSSFLILICQNLLSRVSYQLYSIFVPLPFLFVGSLISFVNFSITISLSLLINLFLNIFYPGKLIPPQFIIFNLCISILSILFFYLSNKINQKKISMSQFISIVNIFFVIILLIFYMLFFGGSEQSQVKEFLKKLITEIFESYKVNQNQNIDNIVNNLVTILPSINLLLFMIIFSLNFVFANLIVKKLNFHTTIKIDLSKFYTPVWFSCLYLIFFIISLFFNESSIFQNLGVNCVICMSFSYLIEGYIFLSVTLQKIKTHFFIKFLIIFLLFLFLGYVLLLIILFLGYFRNLKKLRKI